MVVFVICQKYEDDFSFLKTEYGDAIKIVNLVVFSYSNGYLQTLACCWAPQRVSDEKNQESVGYFLSLSINVGIIIGSAI